MNVAHYYKVAEHNFCLNLPESEKLWNSLDGQYGPFEITKEKAVAEGLLFSIDYNPEAISVDGAECIYDVPTEDGETVTVEPADEKEEKAPLALGRSERRKTDPHHQSHE